MKLLRHFLLVLNINCAKNDFVVNVDRLMPRAPSRAHIWLNNNGLKTHFCDTHSSNDERDYAGLKDEHF